MGPESNLRYYYAFLLLFWIKYGLFCWFANAPNLMFHFHVTKRMSDFEHKQHSEERAKRGAARTNTREDLAVNVSLDLLVVVWVELAEIAPDTASESRRYDGGGGRDAGGSGALFNCKVVGLRKYD